MILNSLIKLCDTETIIYKNSTFIYFYIVIINIIVLYYSHSFLMATKDSFFYNYWFENN